MAAETDVRQDAMVASELSQIMQLENVTPLSLRAHYHDPNHMKQAFGGQVLAQAMRAAYCTVEPGRDATLLQAVFMQGMRIDQPAEYEVTRLQDGRRFSSRHVHARQGERLCLDALVSFQVPQNGPSHQAQPEVDLDFPPPETVKSVTDLGPECHEGLKGIGFLPFPQLATDVRPVDAPRIVLNGLESGERLRYWVRTTQPTVQESAFSTPALAFLSDTWAAYSAVATHMAPVRSSTKYCTVTLNHTMWFYETYVPMEWLKVVQYSPCTTGSRGLALSHFYNRSNRLVATAAQEILYTEQR